MCEVYFFIKKKSYLYKYIQEVSLVGELMSAYKKNFGRIVQLNSFNLAPCEAENSLENKNPILKQRVFKSRKKNTIIRKSEKKI